jgi:hypothetical protein
MEPETSEKLLLKTVESNFIALDLLFVRPFFSLCCNSGLPSDDTLIKSGSDKINKLCAIKMCKLLLSRERPKRNDKTRRAEWGTNKQASVKKRLIKIREVYIVVAQLDDATGSWRSKKE